MEVLSIEEILIATGGKLIRGNPDSKISSVSIDSRNVSPDGLFVPIKGQRVDSHMFIEGLIENLDISASFVETGYYVPGSKGVLIEVPNSIKALQDLAKYYRKKFDIPFIGVTGSVGKTTTKEMIASILSENMTILKSEGNQNGQIGVPLTILSVNHTHQAAIVEMGISEFGEMERLADIADVNMAVITNIGISHIENFKTEKDICKEKLKILKSSQGKIFLNGDNPYLSGVDMDKSLNIIYFGLNGVYPYRAEEISVTGEKTNFVLITEEFRDNIEIPCLGVHNVYNAIAGIALATNMGMHLDDIKEGLKKYRGIRMRQQISHIGEITIIDDSYNASPDSVKSSISVLRSLNGNGKNIVVMADMLEIGERSPEVHFDIGRYMALEGIDILITIGDMARYTSKGAQESSQEIITIHCDSNVEAANKAMEAISYNYNAKVLVKGSRGMHTDEVIEIIRENSKNQK